MKTRRRRIFQRTPEWGIDPVPSELRRFEFVDGLVLWFNLGISLLLPIVAAFLVPSMSFATAMLAIGLGALIGNAMLGYAGLIGAATGSPAMVLYRPSLGRAGSLVPTALNVLQMIGWGAFELIVISAAASAISHRLLGVGGRPLWTVLFGAVVTLMAMGGPLVVVREWLRRYAVWFVLGSSLYLTVYVLGAGHLATVVHSRGHGMPFWQGVDLVVAMPISWLPMAADYTRFARTKGGAMSGTGLGYGVAQAWMYGLGVLLILSKVAPNLADTDAFISAVVAVPLGLLVMSLFALGELDKPFANVYSASVSVQNALPRSSQRRLSLFVGGVCTVLALVVPLAQYENFLLLIGAVFVPLFGVQAAHYAVVRGGYGARDVYEGAPAARPWAWLSWGAGFLAYNWLNPGTVGWWEAAMRALLHDALHLPFPGTRALPWAGASLASFVVAFFFESTERLVVKKGRKPQLPKALRP